MKENNVGFTRLTASAIVNEGATLLYSLVLLNSVTGGDVTLYEGLDASSGRKIGTFEGESNISKPIQFTPPLYLDRGLYVVIGSNVTEVTISWLPAGAG